MRWHFHVSPPADGATNMAVDEALMRRASRTESAAFRVYGWSEPTLSLGRNQRARGCYDTTAASELGVAFVRRPTGGRALLHDHEITYSVTMPVADAAAARTAYDFINDVLLAALDRLGVEAERATAPESVPPGMRPCFDVPAARELVVHGQKLVGSAQWRRDGSLLQHGSILVRNDQALINRLAVEPTGAPAAATLADTLGRDPSIAEVAEPILESLERAIGARAHALCPDGELDHDVAELRARYLDDSWTWRR